MQRKSENQIADPKDVHTEWLIHCSSYECAGMLMVVFAISRSDDYGKTFLNDTDKFDNDTVIEWYYISPQQNNVRTCACIYGNVELC